MRTRVLFILIAATMTLPHPAWAAIACADSTPAAATPAATPAPDAYPAFPDEGGELRIMAAASLTDAFGEMESVLEAEHPGLDIVIEAAGSQTLVTQLQQGAEADILATADLITMQTAVEDGLIDGDPVQFSANRLVIASPEGNPAGIESLDDLAGDDVTLVLAGEDVPAGNYARSALCAYAATADAPDGFLNAVEGIIVSEEPDVRHVMTKLILGEADAGIVYASDAVAADRAGTPLTVIELPEGISAPAVYPIAPVAGGNTDLARAFIGFVLSDDGQAILKEFGFT